MYDGGCNDTGCFGIKIRTNAAKLTIARIARFRQCRDLVRSFLIVYIILIGIPLYIRLLHIHTTVFFLRD